MKYKLGALIETSCAPFIFMVVDISLCRRFVVAANKDLLTGKIIERDFMICEDGQLRGVVFK